MIENMIASGDDPRNNNFDWKATVLDTENALISTRSGYFTGGNVAYDIKRMIDSVNTYPSPYGKFQNIRTALQFFVLMQFLRGEFVILNDEEAPLVEASVGRIMEVGQKMKTVMDEPFVFRAAVNYFRQFDPDFHSALCCYFSLPDKASDLGHAWEYAVLPSLRFTFHEKVLSKSVLIPQNAPIYAFSDENLSDAVLVPRSSQKTSVDASNDMALSDADPVSLTEESGEDSVVNRIDGVLTREARIVGLDEHMYGISHNRLSLSEFLDAHVHNRSRLRRDGTQVPAFYYPAENPTGPDIIFVIQFEDGGCCPVFIQMKLCVSLKDKDVQSAFRSVMAHAVQGHLGNTELETFCTVSPKLFLGVVVAYPIKLPDIESLLSRRGTRSQDAEIKRNIWGMLLKIDGNNKYKIFPEKHMKALSILKGLKRELEQINPDSVDERPHKQPQL